MESDAVLREPTMTSHVEEAQAKLTNCTDLGKTTTDGVLTDGRTGDCPVEPAAESSRRESDRGFHGGERNNGVHLYKEREPGAQESQIDENLNGSSSDAKDSPTESDVDTAGALELKTEPVEDYDAENVIKNQHMYYLYCPCCGEDITKTVRLVRRSEIQPENGRKNVTREDQNGKEKLDPEPVLNLLRWFLHIVTLLFRYIVASLFLYIFALWFLFISPEKLPSASSPHFISVFALLFLAILALCSDFSPGSNEKKDREKVNANSSGPRPPQESEPHVATEAGSATANETGNPSPVATDPNSQPKDILKPEITINSPGKGSKLEILKSVVYGGLIESITSLGIVSSASGSGASSLKIMVMGLANLSSGLTLIVHNLLELKNEKPRRRAADDKEEDRYEQLLGRREKFYLHAFVVISSFIVFGLIPPLVYGFSFRRTDKRHYKAAAVLAASLICIISLAVAKAHFGKTRGYLKTVFGYTKLAIGASGISYIVGDFVNDLLVKYGFYDESTQAQK